MGYMGANYMVGPSWANQPSRATRLARIKALGVQIHQSPESHKSAQRSVGQQKLDHLASWQVAGASWSELSAVKRWSLPLMNKDELKEDPSGLYPGGTLRAVLGGCPEFPNAHSTRHGRWTWRWWTCLDKLGSLRSS